MAKFLQEKIMEILDPIANKMGFEIVVVRIHGGSRTTLEILVDTIDIEKKVTLGDCTNLSNNFSAILDVEDVIDSRYFLEVSSAGVERPLVKLSDYEKFSGREVLLKLKDPVNEMKKIQGVICVLDNKKISIEDEEKNIFQVDFENIKSGKLVFSEKMFRSVLSANQ